MFLSSRDSPQGYTLLTNISTMTFLSHHNSTLKYKFLMHLNMNTSHLFLFSYRCTIPSCNQRIMRLFRAVMECVVTVVDQATLVLQSVFPAVPTSDQIHHAPQSPRDTTNSPQQELTSTTANRRGYSFPRFPLWGKWCVVWYH